MSDVAAPEGVREWMFEQGLDFATSEQLAEYLGCAPHDVPVRLRGAREAGTIINVTKGGWAAAWDGGADPQYFIDSMMRHLGHSYYVGFLSAAVSYRRAHHAIQTFTVAVNAKLRDRVIGGVRVRFPYKPDIEAFPVVRHVSCALGGQYRTLCNVSTPEVTLFDMVDRPRRRGDYLYLNPVAEMMGLYGSSRDDHGWARNPILEPLITPETIAETGLLYKPTTRQRMGYLLDAMSVHTNIPFDTGPLRATLPSSLRHLHYDRCVEEYDLEDGPTDYSRKWNITLWGTLEVDV